MSVNQEFFHIVFATKGRKNSIVPAHKRSLYNILFTLLKDMNCDILRINGMEEHVHIFVNKSPRISTEDMMRVLKAKSSKWMKTCGLFPQFDGWCREYYCVSKSESDKQTVIDYITNQEKHHASTGFRDEMVWLHSRNNLRWYEGNYM